jgi:hypothetical protein
MKSFFNSPSKTCLPTADLQPFNYCSFAVLLGFPKEQQKNSKRNAKEMPVSGR